MLLVGVTLQLYDKMSAGLKGVTSGMDKLTERTEKLRHASMGLMTDGFFAGAAVMGPIKAFANLDDAMATLEVSMMQKGGKVSAAFEPLKKQIVDLGNKLPGTTADYAELATTMISLGIPAEKLVGGALEAAADLRVVLKMTSEDAGETVVKMREAYNLTSSELPKVADIAQRAKFAFGLKPEDLRVAASYSSAQLNILHLGGLENMKKMLVLQGMANLKGLDGSSFGTNMAMMLQRLATGPKMMEMGRRGMKGVGKSILDSLGIKFNFFDKKGNFLGLDNMVKELEKFKIIEKKYGVKGVSEVSNALFGIESARPAMILAHYGEAGYKAALKRFEEQASLQRRIDRYLKTAENTWKAFTGTLTNLMAAFAGPAVEMLEPYIRKLNEITGGPLQKFIEEHVHLSAAVMVFIGLFSTVTIGLGAIALGFAGVVKYIALVRDAYIGLRLLLVSNPLGALIALLAIFATAVYANWEPIKQFFKDLWKGIKDDFNEFIGWLGSKVKFFADMTPGWVKKYTLPGMALNKLADVMGPDKAITSPAASPATVRHEVDMYHHYDGRPPKVVQRTSQPGVKFNAYAGNTMVTQ